MDFDYDVVIIGGAFSGAVTALMIKRKQPAARVLIIEKNAAFDRKVGESTTEVSSCYMTRILGLANYLGHEQLAKQGLRMWFCNSSISVTALGNSGASVIRLIMSSCSSNGAYPFRVGFRIKLARCAPAFAFEMNGPSTCTPAICLIDALAVRTSLITLTMALIGAVAVVKSSEVVPPLA